MDRVSNRIEYPWRLLVVGVCVGSIACGEPLLELTIAPTVVDLELREGLISLDDDVDDDEEAYRGAGNTIRTVSCQSDESCPQPDPALSSLIEVACVNGRCNPKIAEVCMDLGRDANNELITLDLDASEPNIDTLFGEITAVDIQRLRYEIVTNTVSVPLPAPRLFFGPATALRANQADIEPLPLGSLPTISARQVTDDMQPVTLNDEGKAALSDYLRDMGRAVRLFACAELDLEPGDAFPEGRMRLRMELSVKLNGAPPR